MQRGGRRVTTIREQREKGAWYVAGCCSGCTVLHCVVQCCAVCCSVLQCVAKTPFALSIAAPKKGSLVWCSVLQCVAVCGWHPTYAARRQANGYHTNLTASSSRIKAPSSRAGKSIGLLIGLFCKRAILKRWYSAKEIYNFKGSSNVLVNQSTNVMTRLLKIISLFCTRALQKRRYSAKETYKFKEPTNRSLLIVAIQSRTGKSVNR